ncbi:MAG: class I SAM-dependent methyltransferase [Clostridia bacterium]|nr:class I SAM-dependent methyltransferase [Clostridia bacterium]
MAYLETFAGIYDAFTDNVSYADRAAFVLELLRDAGISDGILTDLACGTGTMSAYFADVGFDVIAIDASPDMLMRAREKLAAYGEKVLFLCQDMRSLDLYGTVRATVCSLDGINHLLTPEDVLAAFRRVALFTEPGGVFIFDVNTPYKHRQVLENRSFVYENDDCFLVWQNELDAKTDTVDMLLDIFTLQPDGGYLRDCDEITERAYETETLCDLLKQAGFSRVTVYADLQKKAPAPEEERIYFTAIKE